MKRSVEKLCEELRNTHPACVVPWFAGGGMFAFCILLAAFMPLDPTVYHSRLDALEFAAENGFIISVAFGFFSFFAIALADIISR